MNAHPSPPAHRLLAEARTRLAALADGPVPPLSELLARLVIELSDQGQLHPRPNSLGTVVDEATAHLLNQAPGQPLTRSFDVDLDFRLRELDRLPHAERLRLLSSATRPTTSGVPRYRPPAAPADGGAGGYRRTAGRCSCACAQGGFCGGCGHAGCGGRR